MDILASISKMLALPDIYHLSLTCQTLLRRLFVNDVTWMERVLHYYPEHYTFELRGDLSWQEFFKSIHNGGTLHNLTGRIPITDELHNMQILDLVDCGGFLHFLTTDGRHHTKTDPTLMSGMGPHKLTSSDTGDLKFVKISGAAFHCLALTENGQLYGIGSNNCGKLTGTNPHKFNTNVWIPIPY
ncbi:MAG: RCC1-like domain-containing protein, partial [Candidatus Roizmanbacteria bacterium]